MGDRDSGSGISTVALPVGAGLVLILDIVAGIARDLAFLEASLIVTVAFGTFGMAHGIWTDQGSRGRRIS